MILYAMVNRILSISIISMAENRNSEVNFNYHTLEKVKGLKRR